MFKRMIPLASAALLLFSCGGGNSTTSIKVNEIKRFSSPKKNIVLLSSKETDFKKEKKYSFTVNFSDYEVAAGEQINRINIFLIGEVIETEESIPQLKTYDVLDEETVTISYNGQQLKKVTLTDEFDFADYTNAVAEDKGTEYDNTYVYVSGNKNPKINTVGFVFALYNLDEKDKIVINGTTKSEQLDAYAMYRNGNLAS